jgi:predicted glycosyltransferase
MSFIDRKVKEYFDHKISGEKAVRDIRLMAIAAPRLDGYATQALEAIYLGVEA